MKPLKTLLPILKYTTFLTGFVVLFFCSCTKETRQLASDKAILSFYIVKSNGNILDTSAIGVQFKEDSIFITVPPGTDLTNLTPQITIKGVSVSPASGESQDFSSPVSYTVTAEDGTTRIYIVTVSWNSPHNMLYMGSSNHKFYALDALTGELRWEYTASDGFSYSSPTVANGTVYAGSIDGNLYAFDASTGDVLWKFAAMESIESSPAVSNGVVYFGSDDDYFYAVDAGTGALKWKHRTGFNVGSSPTIVNNIVYAGSDDNNLYAFDANTGEIKWTFTSNALYNKSSPLYVDGVIYIGSRDSHLYAIDAVTGSLKWSYYADGISLEMSSPTISNGIVYIGGWYNISDFSKGGSLVAVDAQTGTLVWKALDNLVIGSSPFISAGSLYISADDMNFYSVNAGTGQVNWKVQILPNGASAVVADHTVYVGGGGTGYFYAFDETTGFEKWRFFVGNGLMTSNPCVIDTKGVIYHCAVSGEQS